MTRQTPFPWRVPSSQSFAPDGTINGRLNPTGLRPIFLDKFAKRGIDLPAGIFTQRPVATNVADLRR